MPIFLTLRDAEGATLVTAMLPPVGQDERSFRPVIVGVANSDPSRSTETLSRPSRSNLGSCSAEAVLNPTESLTAVLVPLLTPFAATSSPISIMRRQGEKVIREG